MELALKTNPGLTFDLTILRQVIENRKNEDESGSIIAIVRRGELHKSGLTGYFPCGLMTSNFSCSGQDSRVLSESLVGSDKR